MSVSMYGAKSGVYRPSQTRRASAHRYNPLEDDATLIANRIWEESEEIADILAPDSPADMDPLEDEDQWMLLEKVALQLSPSAWDDPDAISALYRFRQKFAPALAKPELKVVANMARKEKAMVPDPNVTPENPAFAAQQRRIERGAA